MCSPPLRYILQQWDASCWNWGISDLYIVVIMTEPRCLVCCLSLPLVVWPEGVLSTVTCHLSSLSLVTLQTDLKCQTIRMFTWRVNSLVMLGGRDRPIRVQDVTRWPISWKLNLIANLMTVLRNHEEIKLLLCYLAQVEKEFEEGHLNSLILLLSMCTSFSFYSFCLLVLRSQIRG